MKLLDLPDVILFKIFLNLRKPMDLLNAKLTCKRLCEIEEDENIWKWFCQRDFNAKEEDVWENWTYREFYINVLSKYGYLLGWWQRQLKYYGGLFLVKMEKDGIVGYECLPPLDNFAVNEMSSLNVFEILPNSDYSFQSYYRLRFHPIFALKPNTDGSKVRFICYGETMDENGQRNYHNCENGIERANNGFRFHCTDQFFHSQDSSNVWFELDHGFRPVTVDAANMLIEESFEVYYCLRDKFRAYAESRHSSNYERLLIQGIVPNAIKCLRIQPGLFCSRYSTHGWEIFNFKYNEDGTVFEGYKVKGDPNIPAGQLSVRVHLTKPIQLTMDDYATIEMVKNRLNHVDEHKSMDDDAVKPFRMPDDAQAYPMDENVHHPNTCRWTFASEGQMADHNFMNSMFGDSLFVGFDEDTFAVIWLTLDTFYYYYRVKNI